MIRYNISFSMKLPLPHKTWRISMLLIEFFSCKNTVTRILRKFELITSTFEGTGPFWYRHFGTDTFCLPDGFALIRFGADSIISQIGSICCCEWSRNTLFMKLHLIFSMSVYWLSNYRYDYSVGILEKIHSTILFFCLSWWRCL